MSTDRSTRYGASAGVRLEFWQLTPDEIIAPAENALMRRQLPRVEAIDATVDLYDRTWSTLGGMLAQAQAASERESRTAALYALSRELAQSRKQEELAIATARRLREVFGIDAAIFLTRDKGSLTPTAKSRSHFERVANSGSAKVGYLAD